MVLQGQGGASGGGGCVRLFKYGVSRAASLMGFVGRFRGSFFKV